MDLTRYDKLQIIKNFRVLPKPTFCGEEDVLYGSIWSLYYRVCESIKSFLLLFENKRFCDAYIIAGHALESCAMLSYIKDCKDKEEQTNKHNKFLASSALGRLKACLELEDNLNSDASWNAFVALLKIFYPIGTYIIKDNKNPKEKHEEVIKLINYRKGSNKEKIGLFKRYYEPIKPGEYIKVFRKNIPFDDHDDFSYFYSKYCSFKHSNTLTPGLSFEDYDNVTFFKNSLNLILGLIIYLEKSDFFLIQKEFPLCDYGSAFYSVW